MHLKPNGDPFYVGKGTGRRAYAFGRRNSHHKNIVEKYGRNNIIVCIFPCDSEKQAFADEIKKIYQLRKDGFKLANVTSGGEGVSGLRQKISEDQKRKLSIAGMGNKNCLGWRHTKETKEKMYASRNESEKVKESRLKLTRFVKETQTKKIKCNETGEIFSSSTVAAKVFGLKNKSSISKVCRGCAPIAAGHTFSYI